MRLGYTGSGMDFGCGKQRLLKVRLVLGGDLGEVSLIHERRGEDSAWDCDLSPLE
jgi:hypothetical protein